MIKFICLVLFLALSSVSGECPASSPVWARRCPDPSFTLSASTCTCYKNMQKFQTYADAIKTCAAVSATVPIIKNEAENIFLTNFADQTGASCWIGLSCTIEKNPRSCKWIDGTAMGFSNFFPGLQMVNLAFLSIAGPNGILWQSSSPTGLVNTVCQTQSIDRRV